jgi:hypothetical protein
MDGDRTNIGRDGGMQAAGSLDGALGAEGWLTDAFLR